MIDYKEIRHTLHEHPQTAGCEQFAHDLILSHLQQLHPDRVYTHVGGWGVIAVWGTDPQAPTIAFRADTDALPIGHRCGHDGHTTILLRLAELINSLTPNPSPTGEGSGMQEVPTTPLSNRRGAGGEANLLLLWQPAEETGTGSRAVIESGILQQYNIRAIYALHNIPGYPLGTVVLCPHTFAAASTGVVYRLDGRETHASTPELGLNPGLAVAEIIQRFAQFNSRPPAAENGERISGLPRSGETFRQSTLICVRLGEPAFGTSAGHAELMFTLRAFSNQAMEQLLADANSTVDAVAALHGLDVTRSLVEPFHATENHAAPVEAIRKAAGDLSLEVVERERPMRWSEDFAEYLMLWPGAMFGSGSGEGQPELHHPSYEFPDSLVEPAARMFLQLARG